MIADIALYTDQGMYNASGFGAPEELQATIATHNLFRVLGIDPLIGTVYPADIDRTRRFELLISHGLWTRRFGQDPDVLGRTMTLDGAPGCVIHGVLPPGITFPTDSDLFRSAGISSEPAHYTRRDVRGYMAVARLQPGVTVAQARGQIEALGRRLAEAHPVTNAGLQFHVLPLRDLYVGDVRGHVLLLFAAVGLVMLVACANVVHLLLSRTVARLRERAVPRALGATRWHVARQALVEGLVLATLGGLAGWGLAWLGVHVITRLVHAALPPWMSMTLDPATLGFLVAISVAVGVMAGLIPSDCTTTAGRGLPVSAPRAATTTMAPMMSMSEAVTRGVRVQVLAEYSPARSAPAANGWFFLYTVTITNESRQPDWWSRPQPAVRDARASGPSSHWGSF